MAQERFSDFFTELFNDSLRHLESYGGSSDAPGLNSPQRRIRVVEFPTKTFVMEMDLEEFGACPPFFEFIGVTQRVMEGRLVPMGLSRQYLRENGFGGKVFLDSATQKLNLEISQGHFARAFQDLTLQEQLGPIGKAYCLGSVALALTALDRRS